ncbi:anaerobic selenocysteine-containing dehydrogenase [Desulfomicrobium macestii]|uniref:Anaerobic selenocysteine-containing dehydrogenase n=1 Tax=Desulfomicrobium macestii TaxID=90731 RepID=A0ABR9H9P5_9BACT|nr:molybdopterin-dependent oxidoreductase [Desulfomicrobium macestii]MBE1427424.1 anaerobic selenocysteine-containing dehydrogenase [Desulfomicrobium macestii]
MVRKVLCWTRPHPNPAADCPSGTGVAGLQGDPKSGGRLCPKGGASPKHVYSAYRLKTPLIRENGRFRKAGWDEALDLVATRLASVPEGKLAYFRGNDLPTSFL